MGASSQVLAYEMIDGNPPFLGNNEMEVYDKVLKLDYSYSDVFTPDSKDLIKLLICLEPSKRLGNLLHGAEDIKSHKWFSNPSAVVNGDRPVAQRVRSYPQCRFFLHATQ